MKITNYWKYTGPISQMKVTIGLLSKDDRSLFACAILLGANDICHYPPALLPRIWMQCFTEARRYERPLPVNLLATLNGINWARSGRGGLSFYSSLSCPVPKLRFDFRAEESMCFRKGDEELSEKYCACARVLIRTLGEITERFSAHDHNGPSSL